MKKILLLFLIFQWTLNLLAQNADLKWFTNLETAKEYATENQTDILMVFSGSDWCKPCMKFKKDILEAADFQQILNKKLVILYLDFPAKKKNKLSKEQTAHNETLAERFNKSGLFPNIFLINENEKLLAKLDFKNQNAMEFSNDLKTHLSAK